MTAPAMLQAAAVMEGIQVMRHLQPHHRKVKREAAQQSQGLTEERALRNVGYPAAVVLLCGIATAGYPCSWLYLRVHQSQLELWKWF